MQSLEKVSLFSDVFTCKGEDPKRADGEARPLLGATRTMRQCLDIVVELGFLLREGIEEGVGEGL